MSVKNPVIAKSSEYARVFPKRAKVHADPHVELAMIARDKHPDLDQTARWKLYPANPGYAFQLAGWSK